MTCPHCGAPIKEGSEFCTQCFKSIYDPVEPKKENIEIRRETSPMGLGEKDLQEFEEISVGRKKNKVTIGDLVVIIIELSVILYIIVQFM